MASPPEVTTIIPCYNRVDYIDLTLESVLSQTYSPIKIVVVDDGSTDGTRAVLERYKDKITILEHPNRVNKGQSAAINLGLRQAHSKYIAILDSDDLWVPEKIEKQVSYLEEHKDVGLVYGNGFAIDEQGKEIYKYYPHQHVERNNPEDVLLNCYFLVPNNSLFRRSAIEKAGEFDERLRAAQDHDMAIRMAEVTRLAYVDEVVFYYRRHRDSISHKSAKLRWCNGFIILRKAANRYPYTRKVIRKRKAVLHFRLGQCFVEEKKFGRALYHFLCAGCMDPMRSTEVIWGREKVSSPH